MTVESGDQGWVERYRRMGYRSFYEDGLHPHYRDHVTIAYGEHDQEAPWLAAGRCTSPDIEYTDRAIYLNFDVDGVGVGHSFRINPELCEVLWKGL